MMRHILFSLMVCMLIASAQVWAEDVDPSPSITPEDVADAGLKSVEGEVMEVEDVKQPAGNAIYTIKVFATGQTVKLLADGLRSAIMSRGELRLAQDVLGGAKGTFVYEDPKEGELPMIIYAKLLESTY